MIWAAWRSVQELRGQQGELCFHTTANSQRASLCVCVIMWPKCCWVEGRAVWLDNEEERMMMRSRRRFGEDLNWWREENNSLMMSWCSETKTVKRGESNRWTNEVHLWPTWQEMSSFPVGNCFMLLFWKQEVWSLMWCTLTLVCHSTVNVMAKSNNNGNVWCLLSNGG